MHDAETPPDLAAIRAARERIAPHIHRTPVLTSARLDLMAGAKLFFKCENFQKTGSFKARGAHNAVFSLSASEAAQGVLTHSSGNHGAAVALAARSRGIHARIVVPENVAPPKLAAIRSYGGEIVMCASTLAAREETVARLQEATGAALVHPYENVHVIAGQGTAVLELIEEIPDLQVVIVPIGGGGFSSGTSIAAKGVMPALRVWGAEPAGAADAWRSRRSGILEGEPNPQTIADGLRASLGKVAFPILQKNLEGIVTVSELEIVEAMKLVWTTLKIVIEPSSAVVLAAAFSGRENWAGQRVGLLLSGGNVDLENLPWD